MAVCCGVNRETVVAREIQTRERERGKRRKNRARRKKRKKTAGGKWR